MASVEKKTRVRRRASMSGAASTLGGVRNLAAKAFSLNWLTRRNRRKGQGGAGSAGAEGGGGGGGGGGGRGGGDTLFRGIHSTDFFMGFAGFPTPDNIRGMDFCFEVLPSDGFHMRNDGPTIVVERYTPPPPKQAKAKDARPACVVALSFKTEKVFKAIIEKRMSDTVAVVSGRLKIYGNDKKLDLLEPLWDQMEAKLAESGVVGGGNSSGIEAGPGAEGGEDEDGDGDEEEAWESLTPSVEPRNPCTRRFWARHFGTDALACAWLWLLASVFYLWMICLHVEQSQRHNPPPTKIYNYYCKR